MKPHHCAIVSDEGQDIKGQVSGEIADSWDMRRLGA